MAVVLVNEKDLIRQIRKLSLEEQRTAQSTILKQIGLLVARNSQNAMRRGGKGPPLPRKLTSRTGTGRRSIRSDRPRIRKGLSSVDVGTDLKYMSAHETGGSFTRRAHARRSSTGKTHRVRSHRIRFPERAFLKPGLAKSLKEIEEITVRVWGRAIGA